MRVDTQPLFCRKLERAEAMLGILMTGVIAGLLLIVDAGIVFVVIPAIRDGNSVGGGFQRGDLEPIYFAAVVVISTVLTIILFREMKIAFERNRSHTTYRMSVALARRSILARLIVGAFALIMAAALVALGKVWTLLFESMNAHSLIAKILISLFIFAVSLGAMYASNGYLICFLRAWGFPRGLVKSAYRYRYPFDFAIALGVTWLLRGVLD